MAFLLNAKGHSGNTGNPAITGPCASMMNYYNRFDNGNAVGGEVHPFKGLLIGARYHVSPGKLYKDLQTGQKPLSQLKMLKK